MLNVLGNVLYMYILAIVISFFVALIINTIYHLMRVIKKGKLKGEEEAKSIPTIQLSTVQKEAKSTTKQDEIIAAISLALNLYLSELHDMEKMRITINKTVRPYSPWSSKIYGLNRYWR